MAITKTTSITDLGGLLITNFDADSSVSAHVTGNTTGSLYLVEIDNTANTTTSAYLKIKDAQSAGAEGTLVPNWVFIAAPGATAVYAFPDGQSYSVGLTFWCVTSNAPDNTTSPGSDVVVRLVAS